VSQAEEPLNETSELSISCEQVVPEVEMDQSQTQEEALMAEFVLAAQLLSEQELREFVEEHVRVQIRELRSLPAEQRPQAFRSLLAEWHPDKCPAIAGLATEVFQRLQSQKPALLLA
jgi:hypothetical protein